MIKEANPPSSFGKMDIKVNLKSENWNKKAMVKREEQFNNYIVEQKKGKKWE